MTEIKTVIMVVVVCQGVKRHEEKFQNDKRDHTSLWCLHGYA